MSNTFRLDDYQIRIGNKDVIEQYLLAFWVLILSMWGEIE